MTQRAEEGREARKKFNLRRAQQVLPHPLLRPPLSETTTLRTLCLSLFPLSFLPSLFTRCLPRQAVENPAGLLGLYEVGVDLSWLLN